MGCDSSAGRRSVPPPDYTAYAFYGEAELTVPAAEGLRSAVSKGFKVQLLTYRHLASIPPGVTVTDCEHLLPTSTYKAALDGGMSPQTLADVICAKACKLMSGWIIDPISIWVDSAASAACPQDAEPVFVDGHLFASVPACEGFCPEQDDDKAIRWWLLNYLRTPRDGLMLGKPWRLPRASPLLDGFLAWATLAMGPEAGATCQSRSSTQDFFPVPRGWCGVLEFGSVPMLQAMVSGSISRGMAHVCWGVGNEEMMIGNALVGK